MKKVSFIFIFFTALLACRQPSVSEKTAAFPKHQWEASNQVKIKIENTDTNSLYNIFAVIRHTTAFKYNNLLVNYTAFTKDTVTSGINIPLGNGKRWIGDMLGDIVETRIRINHQPCKLKMGDNIFVLQQIMPDKVLNNILNMGVCIEKIHQ